jgi:2-keto-4-pentenoate hydratase
MTDHETIKEQWYRSLLKAREESNPAASLSSTMGELSVDEAYEVQTRLIQYRIQKGERVIGWKVGATSQSVMDQLHLHEPIFGCMTSNSDYSSQTDIKSSNFCKLAVEGEIAFVLGTPLKGPDITNMDVIRATAGIVGAVELVDCRTTDWNMTTSEAVADNALHAGIILGSIMKPISRFDLVHEGVVLWKNGQLLASACGVEALGNPLNVVTWLANKLVEFDQELRAGDIVSTGSLTKFFFVEPNDVIEVSFSNLGNIRFSIRK